MYMYDHVSPIRYPSTAAKRTGRQIHVEFQQNSSVYIYTDYVYLLHRQYFTGCALFSVDWFL